MRLKLSNLTELLHDQLMGLFEVEKQLSGFLSWSISHASHKSLRIMLMDYAEEQPYQVKRLEMVFSHLSSMPGIRKNKVVADLIREVKSLFRNSSTTEVRDALLISYVQFIVQYKVAAYGIASTLAHETNNSDVNALLAALRESEKQANLTLDKLAVEHIETPEVIY